jgi:hypothetical protein
VLQDWLYSISQCYDCEPHYVTMPSIRLKAADGSELLAKDVELFRVNSVGGEPVCLCQALLLWSAVYMKVAAIC